jgi:hypothetical protein
LRRRSPPGGRQHDQALVVGSTLYETGPLGVADRLLKVGIRQTDVAADAFSAPPGMRARGTEAGELGDDAAAR